MAMMKAEAVGRGGRKREQVSLWGHPRPSQLGPWLPQQQSSQVPLARSQDKVPATHGMSLSHILVRGSLPDLITALKATLPLLLTPASPGTEGLCPSQVLYASHGHLLLHPSLSKCLSACCLDNKEHKAGGLGGSTGDVSLHLHSPASTNHYIQWPYLPLTLQSLHLYMEQ